MIKVVLGQDRGVLGFFEEFRNGILDTLSATLSTLSGVWALCLHLTSI